MPRIACRLALIIPTARLLTFIMKLPMDMKRGLASSGRVLSRLMVRSPRTSGIKFVAWPICNRAMLSIAALEGMLYAANTGDNLDL